MVEQERYQRAFESIGPGKEITMDSLMQRRSEIRKGRMRGAMYTAALFSFLFISSNVAAYAKTGEAWIARVFSFKVGNGIEVTIKEDRAQDQLSTVNEISINTDDQIGYYEVEDDKLYFVLGDEKKDITDLCDEASAYRHTFTDEEGMRHEIAVGGGVENPAWVEYVFDKDGNNVFALSSGEGAGAQTSATVTMVQRTEDEDGGTANHNISIAKEEPEIRYTAGDDEMPAWQIVVEEELGLR